MKWLLVRRSDGVKYGKVRYGNIFRNMYRTETYRTTSPGRREGRNAVAEGEA